MCKGKLDQKVAQEALQEQNPAGFFKYIFFLQRCTKSLQICRTE